MLAVPSNYVFKPTAEDMLRSSEPLPRSGGLTRRWSHMSLLVTAVILCAAAASNAAAQHPFSDTKVVTIISADGSVDCTAVEASSLEITESGGASITSDQCLWSVDSSDRIPHLFLNGLDISCRLETAVSLSDEDLKPESYLAHVASRGFADARITDVGEPVLAGKQMHYLEIAGWWPGNASEEQAVARWTLTRGHRTAFFLCTGPSRQLAAQSTVLEAVARTVVLKP